MVPIIILMIEKRNVFGSFFFDNVDDHIDDYKALRMMRTIHIEFAILILTLVMVDRQQLSDFL